MYDDHDEYEGKRVTPITHLNLNGYVREGYTFTGWNTRPDGTGTAYQDGAAIKNLSAYDYRQDPERGTVTLYAQWKKTKSTLEIDPGEGNSYGGKSGITSITQGFGTTYEADPKKLKMQSAYTVSFDVGGGVPIPDVKAELVFNSWRIGEDFHGRFNHDKYLFLGADGSVDRLTATYDLQPIILPTPVKTNASFGGWSQDPAGERPVGMGGEEYTPTRNTTLYAQWVELVLTAKENYLDNGKKGATDLLWSQQDKQQKTYKIYRSTDGKSFVPVASATENVSGVKLAEKTYTYAGNIQTYVVTHAGFYTLTASGAQGGSYGSYSGGKGGTVSARFFLSKGERLTITVGSVSGYNGGGTASIYGRGGGRTTIVSDKRGTLLVAGGGGGAAPSGAGGAGGANTQLRTDQQAAGQNGYAGGGGGYIGGKAGEHIVHTHVEGVCNHVHVGNPVSGGGCYAPITHTHIAGCYQQVKVGWYWKCSVCGSSYGSGTTFHGGKCPSCGSGLGKRDITENRLGCAYKDFASGAIIGYRLSCGKTTAYTCGYTQGQILSSKPAYGGSSYVHAAAITRQILVGDHIGNGTATVHPNEIGYYEDMVLSGVRSEDTNAPDGVDETTVTQTPIHSSAIRVTFQAPKDNGTQYWWKAESYQMGGERLLGTSNVTTTTLTTGLEGYLYVLDAVATHGPRYVTSANAQNKNAPLKTTAMTVNLIGETQYLHLAPMDVAQNVGETIDIRLEKGAQDWPVLTKAVEITDVIDGVDYGTVYHEDGITYVRADGIGVMRLSFDSYLDGEAREEYQIDHQIFAVCLQTPGKTQELLTQLPLTHPRTADGSLPVSDFLRKSTGPFILKDAMNTGASRSNRAGNNSFYQCFTIPDSYDGETICVTPIAGATRTDGTEEVFYSEWEKDQQNTLSFVADGKGPQIFGSMEGRVFTAFDEGSGVGELTVEINNFDNGSRERFTDRDGRGITVDVDENSLLYLGEYSVIVTAVDRVGNVSRQVFSNTNFKLQAEVVKMKNPQETVFAAGESGVLLITTYGYADWVEVVFPEEMTRYNPELNQIIDYRENPSSCKEERLQFMIPVHTPANQSYRIIVRAYKDGRLLEEEPVLCTIAVQGSIVDEIRTRLR